MKKTAEKITNPFQEIIDWLRSPEGEAWSEERMLLGAALSSGSIEYPNLLNHYGNRTGPVYLSGILSFKE